MDTSSVGFQITIVLFGALAGAVAQNYLLPGKRTSKSNFDLSHSTFKKSKVVIGDTTLNVRQDNRMYVTIDAATRIASEPSADEDGSARRRREEAAHRKRLKELETAGRPKKDEDENDVAIYVLYGLLGLGVIAVAATFYVKYRDVVATILGITAAAALSFVLGGILSLIIRQVKFDWKLNSQIIVNVLLSIAALFSLRWLQNPPFVDDPAAFEALLSSEPHFSISDFFSSAETRTLLWVIVYQMMGILLLVASLALVFLHTLIVLVVGGVAVRTRNDPDYRPSRLRSRLMRVFGGPGRCWLVATLWSMISLVLLSGVVANHILGSSFVSIAPQ